MVPPERPLVYRKIARLYRGCARHATGIAAQAEGGSARPGMGASAAESV